MTTIAATIHKGVVIRYTNQSTHFRDPNAIIHTTDARPSFREMFRTVRQTINGLPAHDWHTIDAKRADAETRALLAELDTLPPLPKAYFDGEPARNVLDELRQMVKAARLAAQA